MIYKNFREVISLWKDEMETVIENFIANYFFEEYTNYSLSNDCIIEIIEMNPIDHLESEKKRI